MLHGLDIPWQPNGMLDIDKRRMTKVTSTKVFAVLGSLLLLSGLGGMGNGLTDSVNSFYGGLNCLLGAVAIKARKQHSLSVSGKWLAAEVVCLTLILLITLPGALGGGWYTHPISFFFIPVALLVGYVMAWRNSRPTERPVEKR
jgi:hypothetical protein